MAGFAERFRTKGTVEIEAIQWTGDNPYAVREFGGMHKVEGGGAHMVFTAQEGIDKAELYVSSSNQWHPVSIGDWIIKDGMGFRACDKDIFAAHYEGY
jgi:hypothetical protein